MNPTVELLEAFFTLLLGGALGVSGTSVGEAWRDWRAVKRLAPDNERAVRNVKKALRNETMRIVTYAVFVAVTLRSLFLPREEYPEGQQYFQIMFVVLIVGLIAETILDRRDRIREMQPIYAGAETDSATADRLALAEQVQRLVVELGEKADLAAAAAGVIARNLEEAKAKVEAVELDLAESHRRAEEVAHGAEAGEAADAASRMTEGDRVVIENSED